MLPRFVLGILLSVGLSLASCQEGSPNSQLRDSGAEQTADEAGVYMASRPVSVTAVIADKEVTVAWKHFGYAVDFVVLRREANAGTKYEDIAVLPNDRMQDQVGRQLELRDPSAVSGMTYIYAVKSRNHDRNGLVVESAVAEAAPVTVP